MHRRLFVFLSASCSLAFTASQLAATPVDWGSALAFQSTGGFVNPLVLVGFNPQPEPPADPLVSLRDPMAPSLSWDTEVADFRILFAIGDDVEPISAPGEPDGTGHFEFEVIGASTNYRVIFDLMTSSGGVVAPGTWEGFNPQPEPPGDGQGIGFDFSFSSMSVASLTFRVEDIFAEQFLSFTAVDGRVPEPSTLWLLVAGFLGVLRRRNG